MRQDLGQPAAQHLRRLFLATRNHLRLRFHSTTHFARGEQLARNAWSNGIVIVGDFEWRETIFADAARLVAPGLAAFAAAEFVRARPHFATSFCDCGTSRVKTPVNTKP